MSWTPSTSEAGYTGGKAKHGRRDQQRGRNMAIVRIGLDIAKLVFQVHGVDGHGKSVLKKTLSRSEMLAYFSQLPVCLIGLEACAGAHYWARELSRQGHDVRLIWHHNL
jgi:hypothetical protein